MIYEADHDPRITDLVLIEQDADSNWTFPLHQHKDVLEVSYVAEGGVFCYLDKKEFLLKQGDVLIKNAGIVHSEKMMPDISLREICISFDGIHLADLPAGHLVYDEFSPVLHISDLPLLRELFLYLADHSKGLSTELESSLSHSMISLILGRLQEAETEKPVKKNAEQTILAVKNYLDEHYAQRQTLENLGEMFYISPYYLSRQFRAVTGYTVKQYILERQMGEAENLLLFTDLPIKEVALQCGYDNLQYFYVTFKKYARLTPVEYRKRYQKKNKN